MRSDSVRTTGLTELYGADAPIVLPQGVFTMLGQNSPPDDEKNMARDLARPSAHALRHLPHSTGQT
jgi:hypothetical protein